MSSSLEHDWSSEASVDTPGARRRGAGWKWGLGCVLGLVAVGLVTAGSCVGLLVVGFGAIREEVRADLEQNPVMRERIGEIQGFSYDWRRSLAEPDEEIFVFDVRGSLASGSVTVRSVTNEEGEEDLVSGSLTLRSGEEYDLFP